MKKLIKRIVPILLSVFMIFGVLDMPVYASSAEENSDGENSDKEGSQSLNGKDGASVQRSGFIIYVSDGSGHAVSKIVAISSMGTEPQSSSGAPRVDMLYTTFGEAVNTFQWGTKPAWGGSPFTTTGTAITAWLKNSQPIADGEPGWYYICMDVLGMSRDEALALADKQEMYLNVETWMGGGYYVGMTHTGVFLVADSSTWGAVTQPNNRLGLYTHDKLVNGVAYRESWLGLSVPSSLKGKHPSSELTGMVGLGISSIRLKPGDRQVIKCYYTAGKLDSTSYSFADESYEIKDEGSYKAKDWFVSEKKSQRSGNTEFSSFQSELPSTRSGYYIIYSGKLSSISAIAQIVPIR